MKRALVILSVFAIISIAVFAVAGNTITKPYTFTPGNTVKSSEVNANFDTLYNRVNQLNRIVVKNNGVEIGTFLSNLPGATAAITFMTSKGYIVSLMYDFSKGTYQLPEMGVVHSFTSSDCTGTPYGQILPKNVASSNKIYYVIDGSQPVLVTVKSFLQTDGSCISTTLKGYYFPLTLNSESVTGVPDSGYSGPITIEAQ